MIQVLVRISCVELPLTNGQVNGVTFIAATTFSAGSAICDLGGTSCCSSNDGRVPLVSARSSRLYLWLQYRCVQVAQVAFSPVLLQESNAWVFFALSVL